MPGPATVDDSRARHQEGALRAVAQPRARECVSGPPGLQERRGHRLPRQLRGSAELRVPGSYRRLHARPEPAVQPADARGHRGPLRVLARRALLEPFGFLRPVRPREAQSQGICREGRLRLARDLRQAAAAATSTSTSPTTIRSTRCRTRRTSARRSRGSSRARSARTTRMFGARSGRSTTRKDHVGAGLHRQSRERPADAAVPRGA